MRAIRELISEIQMRYKETYLQDPDSESEVSYDPWAQESGVSDLEV